MGASAFKARGAWEDRFRRPLIDELRSGYPKSLATVFAMLRRTLAGGAPGMVETLEWRGVPWRWALDYRRDDHVLAYLVPHTTQPIVCLPLSVTVLNHLEIKRISKSVREAIVIAPSIGRERWAQFEVASKSAWEEVEAVWRVQVELASELRAKPVPASPVQASPVQATPIQHNMNQSAVPGEPIPSERLLPGRDRIDEVNGEALLGVARADRRVAELTSA
ncbi:MAG: hypothetical protein SFZ23_12315 [Planctomycetota bacterium]|nr:hypothetical protein [Planctomycetota bacterium]